MIGRQIAADFRRPRVCSFVHGGREEKDDVVDKPRDELFLIHRFEISARGMSPASHFRRIPDYALSRILRTLILRTRHSFAYAE